MFSIAIMADKRRQDMVDNLLAQLGDVPVTYDEKGIWDNRKRATLAYDKKATHHLVLQDDAILCKDFINEVQKQIDARPNHAFSLYFGSRKSVQQTAIDNLIYGGVQMNWFSWGVGIMLPTAIIEDVIEYAENIKGLDNHDDTRLGRYMKANKYPVWYPLPSLIDHRVSESLMENTEGSTRVAFKFLGE